jgi:mannose-6-phosphate isomerase
MCSTSSLVEPGPATPRLLMEEDALRIEQLVACPYFETERIMLPAGSEYFGLCDGATFEIWGVLQGNVTLDADAPPLALTAVQWVLLPAALGDYRIAAAADAVLLRTFVP